MLGSYRYWRPKSPRNWGRIPEDEFRTPKKRRDFGPEKRAEVETQWPMDRVETRQAEARQEYGVKSEVQVYSLPSDEAECGRHELGILPDRPEVNQKIISDFRRPSVTRLAIHTAQSCFEWR